ncbi:LysR family transcriptional regulator [Reinekea sp. G2M2-21]|uniref:LysR family transcriptional regulator n=1 Tax=Reinekea sp. G2M2-21 TaxID=2788942 RepID=UPI0018A972D5|nr:LysR family transcriptional regulator [Reinekea sp. G2M2-21]
MSRFTEMEAFLSVCELNSFTLAAEKLMLSRSRVSQLVAGLEQRVGVRLLLRTTRSLSLTPEGEQFFNHCRDGMRQLASAEANLKLMSTRLTGPVRINAIGGLFGEKYLAEALCDVVKEHPELQLTIDYTSTMIDLQKSPVDLILRIGSAPGDDVNALCLGEIDHTLCASPAFLSQYPFPESPDDLAALPLVCGTPKTWQLEHRKSGQLRTITPNANWRSGSTAAQSVAIEHGLGVGRLLTKFAEPALTSGRLVPVMPQWRIVPTYLWLIWAKQDELPVRIQVVRDHIAHWFEGQL